MRVVITGTSRGIGLSLARTVLQAGHELLAVARDPAASVGLSELARASAGRLRIVAVELREPGAREVVSNAARDLGNVDVLVNNAGVLRDSAAREDFMQSFAINAVAPFEVTQALLPLLKKSGNPRVVHITSKMGSIADNDSGGYYAYRASKAALNMINKSLARDHAWLTTVVVHPGWVRTDMGGGSAPVAPAESTAGIWRLVEGLGRENSGRFYDYQGREIPW